MSPLNLVPVKKAACRHVHRDGVGDQEVIPQQVVLLVADEFDAGERGSANLKGLDLADLDAGQAGAPHGGHGQVATKLGLSPELQRAHVGLRCAGIDDHRDLHAFDLDVHATVAAAAVARDLMGAGRIRNLAEDHDLITQVHVERTTEEDVGTEQAIDFHAVERHDTHVEIAPGHFARLEFLDESVGGFVAPGVAHRGQAECLGDAAAGGGARREHGGTLAAGVDAHEHGYSVDQHAQHRDGFHAQAKLGRTAFREFSLGLLQLLRGQGDGDTEAEAGEEGAQGLHR